MDKFIFVCYDHGCGGENLSVQISKRDYCNTLEYARQQGRTWSLDIFDKLLLKNTTRDSWQKQIPDIAPSEKYYVVPSHREPSELETVFPESIFVVVNFPTTVDNIQHLHNRIYENVWLTSHSNIKQKIGFCEQVGHTVTGQKLKQIKDSLNNAHIHCILNNLDYTDANVERLFAKTKRYKGMNYQDSDKTIALEYNNIDMKKLDRLDEICILHR